jgi:UDP-N-acetylglucosamine acyltransferase
MTPVHQFVHIGAYAMVGGGSRVRMDVVPFALATGEPFRIYGLNRVGLRRHGFTRDRVKAIKDAYRILFWSGLNTTDAVARLKAEMAANPDVARMVKFIERSRRGITPGVRLDEVRGGEEGEGEGGA